MKLLLNNRMCIASSGRLKLRYHFKLWLLVSNISIRCHHIEKLILHKVPLEEERPRFYQEPQHRNSDGNLLHTQFTWQFVFFSLLDVRAGWNELLCLNNVGQLLCQHQLDIDSPPCPLPVPACGSFGRQSRPRPGIITEWTNYFISNYLEFCPWKPFSPPDKLLHLSSPSHQISCLRIFPSWILKNPKTSTLS